MNKSDVEALATHEVGIVATLAKDWLRIRSLLEKELEGQRSTAKLAARSNAQGALRRAEGEIEHTKKLIGEAID